MTTAIPQAYFESLDDLMNVEFKAKRALLGGTRLRYAAAREAAGEPMTLQAARLLTEIPAGTTVFMTTGAGNPRTLPEGETDGPSGTAFLAHVLHARGHKIVLLSDAAFLPGIVASFEAVGLPVNGRGKDCGVFAAAFPLGPEEGRLTAEKLLREYPDAAAGIFIEKPGPNDRGVFHTSSGKPKDPASVAHLHLLAEGLAAKGLVTLGICDGGNEVGFGRVGRALEATMPLARDCGCGCGGGIVNATQVNCLVAASTSNWGAYAVAIAVALLSGDDSGLPPPRAVRASVEASVRAGANDGYSGQNVSTVDGTALEASEAIYQLCLEVVRQAGRLA